MFLKALGELMPFAPARWALRNGLPRARRPLCTELARRGDGGHRSSSIGTTLPAGGCEAAVLGLVGAGLWGGRVCTREEEL